MRKAGPILILLIGIFALLIDFFPASSCPTPQRRRDWRPVETKLGLDLAGWPARRVPGATGRRQVADAGDMDVIKDIVERRVNTTGVSEPVVTTQGADRIVVELPGVTDPEAVRKLVGQTGRLDFVPLGDDPGQPEGQVLDLEAVIPPLFSGDQVSSATRRHRLDRPARGRLRAQGRGRQAVRATTRPQHIGEYFAIVLDGAVVSAPVIKTRSRRQGPDLGRRPRRVRAKEANELVTVLKFGSLPFPIQELSSQQDQRDARRAVPATRASWPALIGIVLGHHVHAASTTACRAWSRASP